MYFRAQSESRIPGTLAGERRTLAATAMATGSSSLSLAPGRTALRGRFFPVFIPVLLALLRAGVPVSAERIKDIATIKGVYGNQLKGYGLVVGLKGTGDGDTMLTQQPLFNFLKRQGLEIPLADLKKSKNTAFVMVTAELPAFSRKGQRLDVTVESLGSASSLRNGYLMTSSLLGPGMRDPTVYAVAEGPLSIGAEAGHDLVARVPGGGVITEEVPGAFLEGGSYLTLLLRHPDFSTAQTVASAINGERDMFFRMLVNYRSLRAEEMAIAQALDPMAVQVRIPAHFQPNPVSFVSLLEGVSVKADTPAIILLNERTSTVVITGDVRFSPVVLSHGTLKLSPPENTADPAAAVGMDPTEPLQELINALNAMQATPRDIISIVQALDAAGALRGEVKMIR